MKQRPQPRTPAPARRSLWAIFGWPIIIGLFSIAGLVAALTGDGWRDVISWLGLAAAVLPLPWAFARRSR